MHHILHNKHADYQIKALIIEQTMTDCNMSSQRYKKLNIPGTLKSISGLRKEKNVILKMLVLIEYLI